MGRSDAWKILLVWRFFFSLLLLPIPEVLNCRGIVPPICSHKISDFVGTRILYTSGEVNSPSGILRFAPNSRACWRGSLSLTKKIGVSFFLLLTAPADCVCAMNNGTKISQLLSLHFSCHNTLSDENGTLTSSRLHHSQSLKISHNQIVRNT